MNKQTEEVYEFMFKDKIANASPLTKEFIQERGDYPEVTGLTGSLEEGQILLPFMEQEDVTDENHPDSSWSRKEEMRLKFFMYPKELGLLAQRYSYLWTVQGMPVMKKRERGG